MSGVTRVITAEGGAIPNAGVESFAVSGDGNTVGFVSDGTNVAAHTANAAEGYVRDLTAGHTFLVSRATGALGAPADDGTGNGHVGSIALNGDGTLVSFGSEATNLGAVTEIISRSTFGTAPRRVSPWSRRPRPA